MSRALLLALFAGLGASASAAAKGAGLATAQDSTRYERLEVHVTAISGTSVYLDRGRVDRIEVGDRVLLFPTSGPQVQAVVRAVSKTSSRVELIATGSGLALGDLGEVLIPVVRLAEPTAPAEPISSEPQPTVPPRVPEHLPERPPWELDLGGVGTDVPLLAPIAAVQPEERPMRWSGRLWFDLSSSEDREGTTSGYDAYRTGFDLVFENAFGQGGQLEFDAEALQRQLSSEGEPDESESRVRLERLNYLVGGDRERPDSWQVGRFLSRGMPEFGRIDGIEYRHRRGDGSSWGMHLGALPEPTDESQTGDDLGIGLFHRWISDGEETVTVQTGYQKTWHKGDADRDLFVVTSNWRPGPRAFLYASAWLDLYGSDDAAKGSGLELTQLIATGTWRTEAGHGYGVNFSHFRFPELLRYEFDPVTAEQLADDHVTRFGVNGWRIVGEGLRLTGRADRWTDQDDSGGRLEVGISARDRLYDGGEVRLGLFQNDNKYSSGPGLRLSATKDTSRGWLRLSFETLETTNDNFFGEQQTQASDTLRASWDLSLPRDWDLSLSLEERFGDAEDATTLGLFVQKRFR
ncbi:MAG: hypothetical protein P1V81_03940 [Planctomycetota bacterium]|nr:hypothetical protein [Planctomycetota bacterium]